MKSQFKYLPFLLATPLLLSGTAHCEDFGPGFVFEIKKNQQTVAYIVGSFHLLREEDHPLPSPVSKAFDNSGKIFFETDLDARNTEDYQSALVRQARLPEGHKLSDTLSPETYALLVSHLQKADLPEKTVAHYQPWMAAMMTAFLELHNAGYDIRSGVDASLLQKSKSANRPLGYLEQPDAQIKALAWLSQEDPEGLVRDTLAALPESQETIPALIEAWKKGNSAPISALLVEHLPADSLYHRVFLSERNKSWLPVMLEAIELETTPPLFVVGAAHLLGKENILDLLRAAGYDALPLK